MVRESYITIMKSVTGAVVSRQTEETTRRSTDRKIDTSTTISSISMVTTTNTNTNITPATTTTTKSVKFNEFTTIREIQSLSELSDKELSDVWYNEDEYTAIKNHVTETMKKVSNGELLPSHDDDTIGNYYHGGNGTDGSDVGGGHAAGEGQQEEWCLRGLEGRTKFGMRKRRNNKARALEAVWSTQIALWKQRMENPSVIAAAYKPHSTNAKYPAIAQAHKDELFLKRLQQLQDQKTARNSNR